jgi:hypothetical protein
MAWQFKVLIEDQSLKINDLDNWTQGSIQHAMFSRDSEPPPSDKGAHCPILHQ